MEGNKDMNNSQLQHKASAISTMASGQRDDAWHWRNSDVSLYSSEKLRNILRMSDSARNQEDLDALQRVRAELEKRASQFERK